MGEGRQAPEGRRRRGVTVFLLAAAAVLCALVLIAGLAWAALVLTGPLLGAS